MWSAVRRLPSTYEEALGWVPSTTDFIKGGLAGGGDKAVG